MIHVKRVLAGICVWAVILFLLFLPEILRSIPLPPEWVMNDIFIGLLVIAGGVAIYLAGCWALPNDDLPDFLKEPAEHNTKDVA